MENEINKEDKKDEEEQRIKIEENDEKFYKIKKHPKIISQELDKITKGEKEGK